LDPLDFKSIQKQFVFSSPTLTRPGTFVCSILAINPHTYIRAVLRTFFALNFPHSKVPENNKVTIMKIGIFRKNPSPQT